MAEAAPGFQGEAGHGRATEDGRTPGRNSQQRRRAYHRRQRAHVRSVRLSDRELADVTAAAKRLHRTVAGFIADAAVTTARAPQLSEADLLDQRGQVRELFAARAALGRVGNNLNQIARAVNAGGDPVGAQAAIAAVNRATTRLDEAAQRLLEGAV